MLAYILQEFAAEYVWHCREYAIEDSDGMYIPPFYVAKHLGKISPFIQLFWPALTYNI